MKAWLSGTAIYKYVCVTCKQTRHPSHVYVRRNQGQKKKGKKRKKERRIDCFPDDTRNNGGEVGVGGSWILSGNLAGVVFFFFFWLMPGVWLGSDYVVEWNGGGGAKTDRKM